MSTTRRASVVARHIAVGNVVVQHVAGRARVRAGAFKRDVFSGHRACAHLVANSLDRNDTDVRYRTDIPRSEFHAGPPTPGVSSAM